MLKKIFAIFTLMLFILASTPCYAMTTNELYYIKNAQKTVLDNKINNALLMDDYSVLKKSPFYAIKTNNKDKYIVIVLRQSGQNVFFYYTTNHNNKISKNFLKDLSSQNIEYLKSSNQDLLESFESTAEQTLNGNTKTYSFDETNTAVSTQNSYELTGYVAMVGKGTKLNAYLQNPINTATAQVGDTIQAVLKEDWIINNRIIAPQGSVLSGSVLKAQHAARGLRNGKVTICFNNILTPDNNNYDIISKTIDFDVSNEGVVGNTVADVVVGAAVGALFGLLVGAVSKDGSNIGKSAAIGAGIGAGGVLINDVAQQGVDAEIPSYTDIEIEINEDIRMIFRD